MSPLVHVRTMFFFFLFLLSLLPSPSSRRLFTLLFPLLSFLFLCLLSVSVSLAVCLCLSPCDVALVLCLVCVLGCWERRGTVCTFKTPSCLDSKRPPCVPASRAHVFQHVRVVPAHTEGVLNLHTGVLQRATAMHSHITTTRNITRRQRERKNTERGEKTDELFLIFFPKVLNLTVFFNYLHMIRIRFFGPREVIQRRSRDEQYAHRT